jgi:YfiH family protein
MIRLDNLNAIPGLVYRVSEVIDGNMSFSWGEKSEVLVNRRVWLSKQGVDITRCVGMSVQHGNKFQQIGYDDAGKGISGDDEIEVDALITQDRWLWLWLITADCYPIIIFDPEKQGLALIHGGRASIDKGVIENTIAGLVRAFDCDPANMHVWIGPGIGKESYVKSGELEQSVNPDWKDYISKDSEGLWHIDLKGMLKSKLTKLGVDKSKIVDMDIDTYSNNSFFSHRRSLITGEPEGRFATVVCMK